MLPGTSCEVTSWLKLRGKVERFSNAGTDGGGDEAPEEVFDIQSREWQGQSEVEKKKKERFIGGVGDIILEDDRPHGFVDFWVSGKLEAG
jgi:hypothetical protein